MRSKSLALIIDEGRARFEEWRQNRQGKSPIPDELWSAATAAAHTAEIWKLRRAGVANPRSPDGCRSTAPRFAQFWADLLL